MLHIPPTNLLLLTAKQESYKKDYLLTKNIEEFFYKKFRRKDQQAEKRWDIKGNRTRQKNKRGDSKVQSNDGPEIPDGGDIRHPRPSFRGSDQNIDEWINKMIT